MVIGKYDLFIFDCDGVLLDTNLLKCQAFGKSVEEYPDEIINTFVEHCKKNFGISRYIKFREFFSDFANEPFNESKYNLFLKKYAAFCENLYDIADITPGTIDLLVKLNKLKKPLFVASGSDEIELIKAFQIRHLYGFFKKIYGSPKLKSECVSEILEMYPHCKAVLIGDTYSDLKSARSNKIDFIYMSKYSIQSNEQDEICKNEAILEISCLHDLL